MRLLLDTHLFLWSMEGDRRMGRKLLAELERSDVFVSVASLWEISIKAALGKLRADPEELLHAVGTAGYALLPVEGAHAARAHSLGLRHGDPFDHLLVAQADVERMVLLTVDEKLLAYGSMVRMAN